MIYFKMFNTYDIQEIGHYPQTTFKKGYNPNLPNSHWQVKSNEFPDFVPVYELELHKNAIPTNYIEGVGGYPGIIVDGVLKKILMKFNLPSHHFYPINVYQNGILLEYYWFHYITDNIFDFINLEKSKIKIQNSVNNKNFVIQPFLSLGFLEKLSKYYFMENDYEMLPDKIYFKDNFPMYDIFNVNPLISQTIISSRLKKKLEEESINGYQLKLLRCFS